MQIFMNIRFGYLGVVRCGIMDNGFKLLFAYLDPYTLRGLDVSYNNISD